MVNEKTEEKASKPKSSTKAKKPKKEEPKAEEKAVEKAAKSEEKKEVTKEEPKKKTKKTSKKKKKETKAFVARGKRKESVARATIKEGKGTVRFNSVNVKAIRNHYVRELITEAIRYVGPEANTVDISVNVNGGGIMGQAQAARTAIANALTMYFEDMNLREKFIAIDRSLVVEDTRRVETKKYRGPKARARYQKSYR